MSAVHDCLFNIFVTTPHIGGRSSYPQPEDAPCRGDRDPQTRSLGEISVQNIHNSLLVPVDSMLITIQLLSFLYPFFSLCKHAVPFFFFTITVICILFSFCLPLLHFLRIFYSIYTLTVNRDKTVDTATRILAGKWKIPV